MIKYITWVKQLQSSSHNSQVSTIQLYHNLWYTIIQLSIMYKFHIAWYWDPYKSSLWPLIPLPIILINKKINEHFNDLGISTCLNRSPCIKLLTCPSIIFSNGEKYICIHNFYKNMNLMTLIFLYLFSTQKSSQKNHLEHLEII